MLLSIYVCGFAFLLFYNVCHECVCVCACGHLGINTLFSVNVVYFTIMQHYLIKTLPPSSFKRKYGIM